ncbi:MAG: hypothetical protein AABW41_04990 [Nanoarchaeota archaeon]
MKKYLFVCRYNIFRSPYSASWFSKYCKDHNIDAEVNSAGIAVEPGFDSETPLTKSLVHWADRILVMEDYMKENIFEIFDLGKKRSIDVASLGIPDKFRPFVSDAAEIERMSAKEALEYLAKDADNPDFLFGKGLMNKILEANLDLILR